MTTTWNKVRISAYFYKSHSTMFDTKNVAIQKCYKKLDLQVRHFMNLQVSIQLFELWFQAELRWVKENILMFL